MLMRAEKFMKKTDPDDEGLFLRLFIEKKVEITTDWIELINNTFGEDYEQGYNFGISYFFDESLYSIDVSKLLEYISNELVEDDNDLGKSIRSKDWKSLFNQIKDLKDYTIYINEEEELEITLCSGCNCMTKSLRLGRANYICAKCSHDKSISDYFQWELKQKSPAYKKGKDALKRLIERN